jgi:dihydrofolate synthase/folylpolyglutamate synthase
MKEVVRASDPRIAALLDRQATQYSGKDQLGLERITGLLDRLGRPQDRLPPVFHVAGTNGKGSTCAFLRFALEASGRRVHMFTSPHLVRYNERIRLAGTLIDDDRLADVMGRVLDANEDIRASLFEINTAAAFIAFSEVPADACVVEVGLGGRLDATNVIERPLVCGIASLGIDHEAFLLAEEAGVPTEPASRIGYEKAGIAKKGVPLVTQHYPAPVEATIAEAAAKAGAPLFVEGRDWKVDPTLRSSLLGEHQVRNANLAWQMLQRQDRMPIGRASFLSGLTSAQWPARFQELVAGPLTGGAETWLDGAHNVEAARALAALLADHGPKHIVLGILANKDADAIVELLAPHALSLTFVPVPDHDHHDPAGLAQRFNGRAASSLQDALTGLPAPRLIAGSLYLAGEALRLNAQPPD